MKERDDHIFDKIIRNKLAPYTEPVPEDIWENISQKRNFRPFLFNNYKLIVSVIAVMVTGLVVTVSMTYNTSIKKANLDQTTIKKTENNISIKTHEKVPYNSTQHRSANDKKSKSAENNKIPEKEVIHHQSTIKATTIIQKATQNPHFNEQNEEKASVAVHQNTVKNETVIIPEVKQVIKEPSLPSQTTNSSVNFDIVKTAPIIQAPPVQTNVEVSKPVNIVNIQSDTLTSNRSTAEIVADKTFVMKPEDPVRTAVADSSFTKLPGNIVSPPLMHNFHLSCIDLIFSPGLVSKSIEANNPAYNSYARMLDQVTKTTYSLGFEIRYRYYLNQFWNIATGLMYNQINEQMTGQTKAEQLSVKQTTGVIISPFDPPKNIIFTDTIKTPAKYVSQNNRYSYVQIPALLGANFGLFKIPFNIYAGALYSYCFKQQGAYINSTTFESASFESSIDNPYKDAQGLCIIAGISANKMISNRSSFFIGIDYTRFVIPINDSKYQFQEYYSIWDLNLGITYLLY
jgi:hypothetical protein